MRLVAGLVVPVIAIAVAGCGGSESKVSQGTESNTATTSASTASQAAESSGKTIFYLGCDESNPFCASYNKTMETTLRHAGYTVTALYNEFNPSVQDHQMAQATAQKPAAIVVFVADSTSIVPSLARAHQAGIPVMAVGTRLEPSALQYVSLVNVQDSKALGEYAAVNLVEGMKKMGLAKGNVIALTGTSSQLDVQERMAGFKAYLAKYPQFKLVAEQDAKWETTVSATDATALFAKYASEGGIQGVYGMADYQATAAIKAAKSAGLTVGLKSKGIIFTGSNCSTAGIEAMQAGELFGDATQAPAVEAEAAAQETLGILGGKPPANKVMVNHEERFTETEVSKFAKECTY